MKSLRTSGFTLLELLVVMAILGVILAAVTSVQSSTMQASTQLSGQANRLRELQDATGYVADRLRAASDVKTVVTINGTACSITLTTSPCFAVLVGEVRQVGSTPQYEPNTYMYLAYRMVPRSHSDVLSDSKATDAWADTNTLTLVEYREVVCQTSGPVCTSSTIPTSASATLPSVSGREVRVNVIMDYATLDDSSGSFAPFKYIREESNPLDPLKFCLKFRQKQQERGSIRYTPSTGPYVTKVVPRNITPSSSLVPTETCS